MLLYPTETLYALGVNALDEAELRALAALKERAEDRQTASWLVRNVEDIRKYAKVSDIAAKIAERFLPGSLTLVLPVLDSVPDFAAATDRTVGFRITSDEMGVAIVEAFMGAYGAPLTCTSANVSGMPTMPTVTEILEQFGAAAGQIDEIHDDGPRKGLASTVVKVVGEEVTVLREGDISEADIRAILKRF